VKGEGAFLNGERIYASENDDINTSLVATGFPYSVVEECPEGVLNILGNVLKNTRGIRRAGSAALDLCYTAKGVFDAYYEFNLSPWDIAGGAVIASEAGAMVTGMNADKNIDLYERFILASSKNIHSDMLKLINS
jgi:myo-inositol-1(or 4)-monophosphatase